MEIIKYFLFGLGMITIISCSSPESIFKKIEENPTKQNYESFIKEYPNSELVKIAKERIEDYNTWEAIGSNIEIEKYNAYKKKFPKGLVTFKSCGMGMFQHERAGC